MMSEGGMSHEVPRLPSKLDAANDNREMEGEAGQEEVEPVARVSRDRLAEIREEAQDLPYNALDQHLNRKRGQGTARQSRKDIGRVSRHLRPHQGDNEVVFESRDGSGNLQGFIAVHKESDGARVEQLLLATNEGRKARAIIAGLLYAAVDALRNSSQEKHRDMQIAASMPSEPFLSVCGRENRWTKHVHLAKEGESSHEGASEPQEPEMREAA